jgi:aryl carrier-like protein
MVPANIVFLDQWPVTRNGKIDRAALPEPSLAATPGTDGSAPEVNWLSGIVSEILGGMPVDPFSSFFELGATSLHLIQLSKRLQAEGKHVSITDLFRNPSVVALAKHLTAAEAGSVRQAALERGMSKRLSRRSRSGEVS